MSAIASQLTILTSVYSSRSKKTPKLHVTGLCAGNSPVTGEFPNKGPVTRKMFLFDDVIMHIIWDILYSIIASPGARAPGDPCYGNISIHTHTWTDGVLSPRVPINVFTYSAVMLRIYGDVMLNFLMTSSNGNIFRVTGPLCGEFTGLRWIPHTKASDAELWCFFVLRLNKRLSKHARHRWFETPSCSLWRHCDVESAPLIPAGISYYIQYKMWHEIMYPFPNSNGCNVQVREWIWNLILHFTRHVIIYPCWF